MWLRVSVMYINTDHVALVTMPADEENGQCVIQFANGEVLQISAVDATPLLEALADLADQSIQERGEVYPPE